MLVEKCPKCGRALIPQFGVNESDSKSLYCWSCDQYFPNPDYKPRKEEGFE